MYDSTDTTQASESAPDKPARCREAFGKLPRSSCEGFGNHPQSYFNMRAVHCGKQPILNSTRTRYPTYTKNVWSLTRWPSQFQQSNHLLWPAIACHPARSPLAEYKPPLSLSRRSPRAVPFCARSFCQRSLVASLHHQTTSSTQ